MPGIGIIVNPYARTYKRDPSKADRLGFIVGDAGSCHQTKSLDDIEQLAQEFKDKGVDIIGISGGDGTIHLTLSAFLKIYKDTPLPKIALLRGGTMNTVAASLGIFGSSERLLSDLILNYHSLAKFEEISVSLLKINDSHGFLFGTGSVSRFIEIYTAHKNSTISSWGAFKLVSKAITSSIFQTKFSSEIFSRFDAKITYDGNTVPFKNFTGIYAGTVESLGFGSRPLYRAREQKDKFHCVFMSTTPRHMVSRIPHAMMGRPSGSDSFFDVVSSDVLIEFDEPQKYMVDGDLYNETNRIQLSTGPTLKIIKI